MSTTPDGSGAPTGTAPHCYRHPERETYISCQRCGRPICPDCMRDASVGFHCPHCVAEAARTVRQPRTFAGGLVSSKAGQVSMILIAINVAAFVAQLATGTTVGGTGFGKLDLWGSMLGDTVNNGTRRNPDPVTGVADGAYWRLLTSAFLHRDVLHIAFNMYALYLFGPLIEQMLGRARFIAAYLTTAVVSAVFVYYLTAANVPTVGASGAIFALFGMALVLLHKRGQDIRFLLALLAINAVLSFTGGVSWQGHLGGLVAGLAAGALFGYVPARWRNRAQWGAFVGTWVAIVVAVAIRTAMLT